MENRISWKKIDIITYSGEYMSNECKAETEKAVALARQAEESGNFKRAAYIWRRLAEKKNYVS